jgi:hypothetical protein
MKPSPLATAAFGIVTGIICLGFVVVAHHVGLPLSDLTKEGLIVGGMASMGVGAWGARQMPTKDEEITKP